MARNWRSRPVSREWWRRWRPWVSLRPSRGRGATINERGTFGLRDLVAEPTSVRARPDVRWAVVGGVSIALVTLIVLRVFQLQVVEHSSSVAAVNLNSYRVRSIPAARGEIFDRRGAVLVGNTQTREIRVSRQQLKADPALLAALSSVTGQSQAQILSIVDNVQYLPYQPAPIVVGASDQLINYLQTHSSEFPGVSVVTVSQRDYPAGASLASQLLGYVGPINPSQLAAFGRLGYMASSDFGQSGVESFYEAFLRGHDGSQVLRVNSAGTILGQQKYNPPVTGNSLILNIDAGLQQAATSYLTSTILRDRQVADPRSGKYPPAPNGALMVMDVTNGHVLAMTSYPSYNLQEMSSGLTQTRYNELSRVGAFNNYAIQGLYTPGSTFKMISATAQLKTRVLSANALVNDTGTYKVPHCLSGHQCLFHDDETTGAGYINLPVALTKSSDYYFYNLGYLFWSRQAKYGLTPIQNEASQYGLDSTSQIDLANEVVGRVDAPAVRLQLHNEAPKAFPYYQWYTGDNIEMAFGQGATAVTPIAMANAYATFANGGTRYAPEVAAAVMSPSGHPVKVYGNRVLGHIYLPPGVRNPILQGLYGVVNSPDGTAYGAFQSVGYDWSTFRVAGKTGTASNSPGQEPNSWFVGFGPVAKPKYVVLCVIGEGGYGAMAAAPAVAQTFKYLATHPLAPTKISLPVTVPESTTTYPAKP